VFKAKAMVQDGKVIETGDVLQNGNIQDWAAPLQGLAFKLNLPPDSAEQSARMQL
jgi:hypothetical protein